MTYFARLAAATIGSLALTAPAPAQNVAVIGNGGQYGYFNLASPTTSYTQVSANAFQNLSITGFAYTGSGSAGYAIARNAGSADLRTVNTLTGANAIVGTIDSGSGNADYVGLAYRSANGTLYTTYYGNDTLRTVNTSPPVVTSVVGGTGASEFFPAVGRMAFAGSSLYATLNTVGNGSGNGLYQLNTSTGAATFQGNGGAASTYTNMLAFGNGSNLYGIDTSNRTLYQINVGNGNLLSLGVIGGMNVPTSFQAAAVAPVPEPTTVLGVAAAGLGLVRLARRRRAGGGPFASGESNGASPH